MTLPIDNTWLPKFLFSLDLSKLINRKWMEAIVKAWLRPTRKQIWEHLKKKVSVAKVCLVSITVSARAKDTGQTCKQTILFCVERALGMLSRRCRALYNCKMCISAHFKGNSFIWKKTPELLYFWVCICLVYNVLKYMMNLVRSAWSHCFFLCSPLLCHQNSIYFQKSLFYSTRFRDCSLPFTTFTNDNIFQIKHYLN